MVRPKRRAAERSLSGLHAASMRRVPCTERALSARSWQAFALCTRSPVVVLLGSLENMANTLQDPKVATVLDRMYTEAKSQMSLLRERIGDFDRPMSAQQRADAMSEFYIPVTPEAGRLLYALVRATRPTTVVEFGMSFGISAVHLASAVRDNGSGRVVTTELSATKIAAAKQTFAETGLDDQITILSGDALSTLADVDGPIEFVLLDGWKDLYLPVIELLEPRLSTGALVVADNASAADMQPYLDRVRNPDNGYVSFNFLVRESDSMEISCRTGD
jgi:predicted O-methyltransferase YrrM